MLSKTVSRIYHESICVYSFPVAGIEERGYKIVLQEDQRKCTVLKSIYRDAWVALSQDIPSPFVFLENTYSCNI